MCPIRMLVFRSEYISTLTSAPTPTLKSTTSGKILPSRHQGEGELSLHVISENAISLFSKDSIRLKWKMTIFA